MTPKGIHLREDTCPLRGPIRNWLLFTVVLMGLPFLRIGLIIMLGWTIDWPLMQAWLIPDGPEFLLFVIALRWVPQIRWWDGTYFPVLTLALTAARMCIVLAWGVFRLQRGKRAPYAETLWLLVVNASIAVWMGGIHKHEETTFCILAAMVGIAGIVIFALQRRRPRLDPRPYARWGDEG